MIHYYTNKEISNLLGINLAKWKRWSRSFLPPDPLGGMQSGYARQYVFKDVFKVFLGGYLISHLKLSVTESKQVLVDLVPWLRKEGFLRLSGSNKELLERKRSAGGYRIYFCLQPPGGGNAKPGNRYLIRKTIDATTKEMPSAWHVVEVLSETMLRAEYSESSVEALLKDPYLHLINLTALYTLLAEKTLSVAKD